MILESHELSFYTDHKIRDNPSAKPLSIYCVLQSTISPYTKDRKKNIIQVGSVTLLVDEHFMCENSIVVFCNLAVNDGNTLIIESIEFRNK